MFYILRFLVLPTAKAITILSGHYGFKPLSEGEHIFLDRRPRHVDSRNYSPASSPTTSGVAIENKGDVWIVERGEKEGLLFLTNNSRSRTWNMFLSRKLGRFSLPTQLVFTAVPRSVIVVRALCRALMAFHLRIARRLLNNAAAILKQLDKKWSVTLKPTWANVILAFLLISSPPFISLSSQFSLRISQVVITLKPFMGQNLILN